MPEIDLFVLRLSNEYFSTWDFLQEIHVILLLFDVRAKSRDNFSELFMCKTATRK